MWDIAACICWNPIHRFYPRVSPLVAFSPLLSIIRPRIPELEPRPSNEKLRNYQCCPGGNLARASCPLTLHHTGRRLYRHASHSAESCARTKRACMCRPSAYLAKGTRATRKFKPESPASLRLLIAGDAGAQQAPSLKRRYRRWRSHAGQCSRPSESRARPRESRGAPLRIGRVPTSRAQRIQLISCHSKIC